MNTTKIDWCDMSWNPITGCKHGCPYCYARRVATRFGGSEETCSTGELHVLNEPYYADPALRAAKDGESRRRPYPFMFDPTFHRYRLGEPASKTRPRSIFVGSMADVFGAWVPTKWIVDIIDACKVAPQHNYLFLTKNPQRYIDLHSMALLPKESNFWYGTSVAGTDQKFLQTTGYKSFISIEPFTERIGLPLGVDWIIVGAMTGPGAKQHQPKREWVGEIVEMCRENGIPVFMKNNLAEVWGPELIREFPLEIKE